LPKDDEADHDHGDDRFATTGLREHVIPLEAKKEA
jgi:hypothetical protein